MGDPQSLCEPIPRCRCVCGPCWPRAPRLVSQRQVHEWEVMEGAPLPALASVFPLCDMGAKCVCAHLPTGSGREQRATNVGRRKEAAVPTSGRAVAAWGGGLLPRLPPPRTATMTTASLASGSADRVPGLFCAVHAPSSQQPLAAGAFVIHTLQIRKSRHRGAREPRPPNSRGVEGAVHSETLTAGSAIFNPVKRPQPGFSQRLSGARPWGARDVGPGGGERP